MYFPKGLSPCPWPGKKEVAILFFIKEAQTHQYSVLGYPSVDIILCNKQNYFYKKHIYLDGKKVSAELFQDRLWLPESKMVKFSVVPY